MSEKIKLEEMQPDPERAEAKRRFDLLVGSYNNNEKVVLEYIAEYADCAVAVVSGWLKGNQLPSPGIRKRILGCLRHSKIQDLPVPVEVPKPVAVPKSEEKPKEKPEAKPEEKSEEIIEEKPKPKRKRIPKEWELEGHYEGLNLYESDLLDYLKNSFSNSEFNIWDIKFTIKKARGHTHMFQHLAYLTALGYMEKPVIRDNRYYYKVK